MIEPVKRHLIDFGKGLPVLGSYRVFQMGRRLALPSAPLISMNRFTSGPWGGFSLSPLTGGPGLRPRLTRALWTALGLASKVTTVSWAFLPLGWGQQAMTSMG